MKRKYYYFAGQLIPELANNSQEKQKNPENNNQDVKLNNYPEREVPKNNNQDVKSEDPPKTKKISDGSHYC